MIDEYFLISENEFHLILCVNEDVQSEVASVYEHLVHKSFAHKIATASKKCIHLASCQQNHSCSIPSYPL